MERHKLCPAESVILDIRDGHYVCTACGLVLDSHYQDVHQTPFLEEHCEIPNKWKEETKDILTRLNIPTCYGDHILQHFESKYDKKNQKNFFEKRNIFFEIFEKGKIAFSYIENFIYEE